MKYVLLDGNNLGIRCAFANPELTNSDGVPTGPHFGFFNSLIHLKTKYPDSQFLITWDGKSARRMKESEEAVKSKIIPELYKQNRKKDEMPKPLKDFYEQSSYLKKGIAQTGIPQIQMSNYEADDLVASYCEKLKKDNNEIICVTSDLDYCQLLDDNVSVYDGMKQTLTTKDSFIKEKNITPLEYVHVGSLMGDDSDNIFGIPGFGETTALETIVQHKTYQNLYTELHKQFSKLREQFPDLNEQDFEKLKNITTKSGKPKYPEIESFMPYTGVVLAFEEKKIKDKIPKTTLSALMFEERVKLAYSLKKMDIINDLPEIQNEKFEEEKLLQYLEYYDIKSLVDSIEIFK